MKSIKKSVGRIRVNTVRLKMLQADLKECASLRVQVGVLGQKDTRMAAHGEPAGNAEIGAIHEFGRIYDNIPRRSFLFDPLTYELGKEVAAQGATAWRLHFLQKGFKSVLGNLGILATKVVDQAFASAGYGRWPANSPMTIAFKGSSSPLIDTAQLRQSISFRLKKA